MTKNEARLLQFETEYETCYTEQKMVSHFLAQYNVFLTQSQIGGVQLEAAWRFVFNAMHTGPNEKKIPVCTLDN